MTFDIIRFKTYHEMPSIQGLLFNKLSGLWMRGKKNPDEQLNKCNLFTGFTFIYLAKKTLIEIQIH